MTTANLSNLVPTTELEAVNFILSASGEAPVDSLTLPLAANAEVAFNLITFASRAVQTRGWQYNTVRALTLTPISHADGTHPDEILVPTGVVKLRKTVNDDQRNFDVSHRHGYLWNNLTNTAKFIAADYPSGVKCDLVYALDFTNLPESMRSYLCIISARSYAEKTHANPDLSGFLKADEGLAYAALVDAEGLAEPTSVIEGHKDQRQANSTFDRVSKEVQTIGWHFNTRFNVGIAPDGSGYINLPTGTLQAVKNSRSEQVSFNVAHRGTRMYDVVNDTAVFVAANLPNGKLYLDLTMYLSDPLTLPEPARRYIEIKAARQMQPGKQTGAPIGFTEKDEYRAFMELNDAQGLIEDNNILNNMDAYRTVFGREGVY